MRRSQTSLIPLVDDAIWVCERPVKFSGAWLRSRSTVVRLEDGGLWVHSPPRPTDELRAELARLGPVRWLVAPNKFHHLELPACAEAYPDATVVGPASVREHNPAVELDGELGDAEVRARVGELEALPIAGVPFLDETVFFHRASGTLIGADLGISATRADHWSWRIPARLLGCYDKLKVPPDVWLRTRATAEAAASLRAILALPIERLAVAHTDLVTDEPTARLERAWRFVLKRFPERKALVA